jgi:glycosyltransferase involved in cell wall biosynthesis
MVTLLRLVNRQAIDPILVLLNPFDESPYREMLPDDMRVLVTGRKSDSALSKLKQMFDFLMLVRREVPDVIVSMLTHNNLMAICAGVLYGIEVVPGEHCALSEGLETQQGKKMLWFPVKPLVKRMYKFASSIVAVSEGIKTDLIQNFSVNEDKIRIIYNPIDIQRIHAESQISLGKEGWDTPFAKVIAIGRLAPQKGFDLLIEAFSQIVTETDARLFILGDGPEKNTLKKRVKALGMSERIYFMGFQKNPYQFLSRADIFVLSSRYEGLPMVLLESLACGVPVIATDCESGPREILEGGRVGLLIPKEDTGALAGAMSEMLKNREQRKKFAILGKRKAKEFSIEKIIKQYEGLIYEAAAKAAKVQEDKPVK